MNSWELQQKRESASEKTLDVNSLDSFVGSGLSAYAGQQDFAQWEPSIYDGGKFAGGFGTTQVQAVDYWTLRARSTQLFNENLYAAGIIRRLVTNEVNTGLTPEAAPDEPVLGLPDDSLVEWTDDVETRFGLWGKTPTVCDFKRERTFGQLQQIARMEALIGGDCLVVVLQNQRTGMPQVQLIKGESVITPWGTDADIRKGHTVKHGVEFDAQGRVFGHWVQQTDGSFKRIPAYGEKSGRRVSWLVYGTDRRLDDVRGQPLLSLVLQSLKEIDRYRDSTQRKAVINSIMAMFIKKTADKPGTLPMTGAATRRGSTDGTDNTTKGAPRRFNMSAHIPGVVFEELQVGEEPVVRGGEGTDTNFGTFEAAILNGVGWALEIPPEVLTLSFEKNYSASQAAINEFKMYINRFWSNWGESFCTPIYQEWLVSSALRGTIRAQGLLDAWRDPARYAEFASWTCADWYGSIKPSTDMAKAGKASQILVAEGWSNNARESRVLTGTKFSRNMKRLKAENKLKADAARPMLEIEKEFGSDAMAKAERAAITAQLEEVTEAWAEANANT